jgi:hypothetical protein
MGYKITTTYDEAIKQFVGKLVRFKRDFFLRPYDHKEILVAYGDSLSEVKGACQAHMKDDKEMPQPMCHYELNSTAYQARLKAEKEEAGAAAYRANHPERIEVR